MRKLEGHDTGSIITSLAVSECDIEYANNDCSIELALDGVRDSVDDLIYKQNMGEYENEIKIVERGGNRFEKSSGISSSTKEVVLD